MSGKKVKVGNLTLGDGHIYIQSMLNVPADDIEGNVRQAKELEAAGCEIIRTAVPDIKNVELIYALKNAVGIPVVADIHFDYRIALECVAAGADKIRINPGNIGSPDRVKAVADACRSNNVPIRIGVNSGSVERELLKKYGGPTAQALAESASRHIRMLEEADFDDIVISVKSSDVKLMTESYRLIHKSYDYPLHLGVTEAGTERMGIIKSAAGIGSLLLDGIGDTIRVSLTDAPVREIYAAKDILKAVGICTEEDNDLEAFLNVRKKPKNFAHVRILDERLVKDFDYFQVSTSDLEHIALPGDNLLVVENVQSGLMLPKLLNTTVIFGCGNDVAWSKAKWLLSKKKIIYWGDLDSWGFFILSNFRKNTQAKVTSVMMDLQTLEYENHLAKRVTEKEPTSIEDPALTEDEIACLDALSKQPNLNRLEQEKLDQDYIVKHLKAVLDE